MNKITLFICIIATTCFAMEKDNWINTTGTFIKEVEQKGLYTIYRIHNDRNQFAPFSEIRTSGELACRKLQLSNSADNPKIERLTSHIVVVHSPGLKRKLCNKVISLTGTEESADLLLFNGFNNKLLQEYAEIHTFITQAKKKGLMEELNKQEALKDKWITWRRQCIENKMKHNEYPEKKCFNPLIHAEVTKRLSLLKK